MFGLEGNKDPEQPEKVQNTRYFVILDDRKYGRTAKIPLFYDVDTGVLDEPPKGFLEDEDCQTLSSWFEMVGKTETPEPDKKFNNINLEELAPQSQETPEDFSDLDFDEDEPLPFD